MAYERREYKGNAIATTLAGSIIASDTTISLVAATNWPTGGVGPFFIVIDRGTASEEVVKIATRSSTTLTVVSSGRGADGSAATSHSAGAAVEHVLTAVDADEANAHYSNQQADPHPMYLTAAEGAAAYVALGGTTAFGRSLLTVADQLALTALIGETAFAAVATAETTPSTTYTDLATAGPAVTLATGTRALVTVSAGIITPAAAQVFIGVALSGATTSGATDTGLAIGLSAGQAFLNGSRTWVISGMTAGVNTFTMKYRTASGTPVIGDRQLIVQPI